MRKIIVLAMVLFFVLSIFMGCAHEITSSDGGHTYDFNVGDIAFHIVTGSGENSSAYNNTSYYFWINVKECDERCDERAGISFALSEYGQTASWRANYSSGDKLKITMRFDGVESINTIKLGKLKANNPDDIDVYIEKAVMKIGRFDNQFDPGIETDDRSLADYTEITFIIEAM